MNKLDALKVLSGAYHHLMDYSRLDSDAVVILIERFHQVRRSLQSIEELRTRPRKQDPAVNEGYNGRMPKYF
jgi:hypothetical protein